MTCRDEVDLAIIDVLLSAGSEGMLPKDIAARLAKYQVSRWHVSRRIVRMNNRLKREIDQNVAKRHGWKWAASSMNENRSATRFCLDIFYNACTRIGRGNYQFTSSFRNTKSTSPVPRVFTEGWRGCLRKQRTGFETML